MMNSRPLALVTGGSSGIGSALVTSLAARGWDVVFQYGRNHDSARAVVADAKALGARCAAFSLDLNSVTSGVEIFEAALEAWKVASSSSSSDAPHTLFDGLVLNAGVDQRGALDEYLLEDVQRIFHINAFVPLLAAQRASQYMRDGSSIAVTSSTGATSVIPNSVPYSMSKAALNMLVAGAAKSLQEHHIRVNGVAPGIVETPLQTPERIAAFRGSGLLGKPQDVASVLCFLLSDEARWINGEIITASGNA